ncbi:DUF1802 family protein [bacterium]|jgi:hypothetical protein|nr:DUF1802 family protein [bacterium]MBT3850490.1 DUF1802 family protein [bacterium]MBT4435807.1 DUF1802 family protein [bacterium]MDG2446132.1 DUF1802 family protein [Thermodesulfobacteriota bacterium]
MNISLMLKEWSSAIKFFQNYKTSLIFRKGGIHEKNFKDVDSYFGFFPTFEHESRDNVKKDFQNKKYLLEQKVDYSGTFEMEFVGKIIKSYEISSISNLTLLDDFHHWENSYLVERFNFKPSNPLRCYLLDFYKIKIPKKIIYNPDKAKGCSSWFEIENPVEIHSIEKINDLMRQNKITKLLESF